MEFTLLGILAVALLGIIIFLFFRLRSTLKNAPGAESKLSMTELVKNWQEQKQKESQYQNELKARARESARPEIEKVLVDRYKQEAIDEATKPKAQQFAEKLGVNTTDMFSRDKVEWMAGDKKVTISADVNQDIFSPSRIDRMVGKGVDENKINDAAKSTINYNKGVKTALQSNTKINIDKILKR